MLITDLIPIGGLALALTALLAFIFRKDKRRGALRMFFARFFGLFWALAAVALLFKLHHIFLHMYVPGEAFSMVNFTPFKTIAQFWAQRNVVQLGGNALAFFPMPLLLWLNFPKLRCGTLAFISLCATVAIEPLQALINALVCASVNAIDIDDLLLNAAGTALGLLVLAAVRGVAAKRKKSD